MTQTVTLMLAFPRFFARCIEPWHLCGARPLRMCRSIGRGRAKAVPAHTSDSAVTVSSTTATAATMSGGDSSTSVTKAASPPTGRSQAPLLAVVEEGDHESRSNHGSQLKASSSGDVQQQQQPFSAAGLIATKRTVWYKVGAVIVKFPCNLLLLIAIFGLAAPFAMHAMHYPTTNSLSKSLCGCGAVCVWGCVGLCGLCGAVLACAGMHLLARATDLWHTCLLVCVCACEQRSTCLARHLRP